MIPTGHLLFQCCEVGSSHLGLSAGMIWGNIKCFHCWELLGYCLYSGEWVFAAFRVGFFFSEGKAVYCVFF